MTSKTAKKPVAPRELKRQLTISKQREERAAEEADHLAEEVEILKKQLEEAKQAQAPIAAPSSGFEGFSMGGQPEPEPEEELPPSIMPQLETVDIVAEDFPPAEPDPIPTYSEEEIELAVKYLRNQAKNNPVTKTGIYDSSDNEIGQFAERLISAIGDARNAIDPLSPIITREKIYSKDKMDHLAFMDQVVTIMIHDTDDPVKQPIPMVINDGIRQSFVRSQPTKVKRKFLEILARCKVTSYTNQRYINHEGDESYKVVPHTVLMYPFQVLEDPSPKGGVWLAGIQGESY